MLVTLLDAGIKHPNEATPGVKGLFGLTIHYGGKAIAAEQCVCVWSFMLGPQSASQAFCCREETAENISLGTASGF